MRLLDKALDAKLGAVTALGTGQIPSKSQEKTEQERTGEACRARQGNPINAVCRLRVTKGKLESGIRREWVSIPENLQVRHRQAISLSSEVHVVLQAPVMGRKLLDRSLTLDCSSIRTLAWLPCPQARDFWPWRARSSCLQDALCLLSVLEERRPTSPWGLLLLFAPPAPHLGPPALSSSAGPQRHNVVRTQQ